MIKNFLDPAFPIVGKIGAQTLCLRQDRTTLLPSLEVMLYSLHENEADFATIKYRIMNFDYNSHDLNSFQRHSGADKPSAPSSPDLELQLETVASNLDIMASTSSFFNDLSAFTGLYITDSVIAEIEGLVALFTTITGCEDYISIASAIFLYVRRFCSKSITATVMEYISELFALEPQSGSDTTPVEPDWLVMMRSSKDNWNLIKGNRFFGHLSKVLGLLVTLGLCNASTLTFNIKEYKIIEPDLKMIHGNAIDIIDAAFGTVTFFVEGFYLSFQQKSLKPLIMNDKTAVELDEEFANVSLWWDLVKNGNLMKVANISEQEFDRRLESLSLRIKPLLGGTMTFEKKLLTDKLNKLLKIKNDYITLKISSGVRRAPFVLELFGASSQGKTTLGDQLIDALLTSAGLPIGKEYRASYNPSDKYMSNWATNKTVLIMDDVANDRPDFVEKPPTRTIIDVCNNQPYYANMADLDSKGKVFVEPELVVVNTNVKNLDAHAYSKCPYSIQRRMDVVIVVEAKREFQFILDGRPQGIDPAKVRQKYLEDGIEPQFDDIWTLSLEKAIQPNDLKDVATYKVIEHKGKKLSDISFREAVQYIILRYQSHRTDQNAILKRMNTRTKDLKLCPANGCCQIEGYCDEHDFVKQSGFTPFHKPSYFEYFTGSFGRRTMAIKDRALGKVASRLKSDIFGVCDNIDMGTATGMYFAAKMFSKHWDWIKVIPTSWIANPWFRKFCMMCQADQVRNLFIRKTCLHWGICSLICAQTFRLARTRLIPNEAMVVTLSVASPVILLCLCLQRNMTDMVTAKFSRQLLTRNTIHPMAAQVRDENVGRICRAVAVLGVLFAMSKLYKRWRSVTPQGSLTPTTTQDVAARDSETNAWTEVVKTTLPLSDTAKCTTSAQLKVNLSKNLMHMEIKTQNGKKCSGALFLTSNLVLIPNHLFDGCEMLEVTFLKTDPEATGGKFASRLCRTSSYNIPGTDLCACYSSTGGSFKNLYRWLPSSNASASEFELIWRDSKGELIEAYGLTKPEAAITNGATYFVGGSYANFSMNTFYGLCCAPLLSKGSGSTILGFHLGGTAGTSRGCYGVLTQAMFTSAFTHVKAFEGVLLTGSAENFKTQSFGKHFCTQDPLHPKSPLNFIPKNSQITYHGSCKGMASNFSDVRVTPISTIVTEVTGQPNIWGPPVMQPQWFGWRECLANMAIPATPYPHDLLYYAVVDYKKELLPIFGNALWNKAKPLTDHENLNGIPGKKFMDAIKLNTAIGYPLTGPKRKFVTELEPTKEYPCNRVFDQVVLDEIKFCEDCYKVGQRAYPIAKACKKDEVLAKRKCRIFYSNPIALTFLIRKYYLPILRVLQMNPLMSECAVGINSHGPEWQEFHDHVFTFGSDRLIGGDYGKYDQKIPSQLILASLRIMMDFARLCNYTAEDLHVMEAMAGDIAFAIIAFNGDLIGLTEGTHISGNSLTVVINGICGSLNQRAYFFSKHKPGWFTSRESFRDCVKLMTYGDDNIGSVRKGVKDFTIKGLSLFLAEYGQIYTMPDKTSDLVDFLPAEDFEFLKRKSVHCPDKGVRVGALLDSSIFKMLHCFLRPKGCKDTVEMASALNIDTALREWANHGREKYEQRRLEMREIASKGKIEFLCTQLEVTYDMSVNNWKRIYNPNHYDKSKPLPPEFIAPIGP